MAYRTIGEAPLELTDLKLTSYASAAPGPEPFTVNSAGASFVSVMPNAELVPIEDVTITGTVPVAGIFTSNGMTALICVGET